MIADSIKRYNRRNKTCQFRERFKGRMALIGKEGHAGVVAKSSAPIEKSCTRPGSNPYNLVSTPLSWSQMQNAYCDNNQNESFQENQRELEDVWKRNRHLPKMLAEDSSHYEPRHGRANHSVDLGRRDDLFLNARCSNDLSLMSSPYYSPLPDEKHEARSIKYRKSRTNERLKLPPLCGTSHPVTPHKYLIMGPSKAGRSVVVTSKETRHLHINSQKHKIMLQRESAVDIPKTDSLLGYRAKMEQNRYSGYSNKQKTAPGAEYPWFTSVGNKKFEIFSSKFELLETDGDKPE